MTFERYVVEQLPSVEPTMDSVATAFLPLLRQVIAAHQAGTVAPLEGIAQLEFADGRLSFVEGDRKAIRTAPEELRRLESTVSGALELIGVTRRVHHGDKGEQQIRADVGRRGEPLMLPVYLPGYVAWEHEAGHHDPLTDAFSLGLILATLALKLNFNEPDDLLRFVEHRRNLFTLDESLNPVLAQVILRLTELDRGRRPRDLEAVASMLENPGDQTIDLEVELARVPGFDSQDGRSRTQSILARLRDRLFDFSRRNNLLSFRPTLQTVNLTVGSMPLRIDLKGIPENRILVWNDRLQRLFVEGKPIALGRYLNFSEAAYLPSQFDGMIAAARRDNQEFGFAQLRLVACFLSWTNLKRKPVERYLSPLVLLPVQLIRTKGVRDSYSLEPQSSIAEINPIVRRQFQELYGIALPESIDLATGSLDELFRYLADRIMGSEPAVVVSKIDRPRIELIHEKARKRVEQYRRSARISGRGIRSYLDLDYSYDRDNYHPLGLRLFSTLVKRPESHLGAIVDESPDSRQSAVPEPDLKPEPDIVEKERTVVEVQHNVEDNPYLWNFDLCNLTLANFRYRRMSLVQDYEAILQRGLTSSGFESAFATDAPPVVEPPPPIDLSERYDVVASDPTQAAAIALARREESYIIQGPPGTGKSQTITNLIADYVARGKRVLFVCEKRAAIDVVYARLKRAGLGPMCCLIHDSQTDKREFIFNLKETYEECQGRTAARRKIPKRKELLDQIRESLAPMERFQSAMREDLVPDSLSIREFLDHCIQLHANSPTDLASEAASLPTYAEWWTHRGQINALDTMLRQIAADGVFANHPLRRISPSLTTCDRPLQVAAESSARAGELLDRLEQSLMRAEIAPAFRGTLARMRALFAYLRLVQPLAENGNIALADSTDSRAVLFGKACRKIEKTQKKLNKARQSTNGWRDKLTPADTTTALDQARRWDGKLFAWLSPGWWRLRGELKRRYDFASHAVAPSWVQILESLVQEHAIVEEFGALRRQVSGLFGGARSPEELEAAATALREAVVRLPDWLRPLHDTLRVDPRATVVVEHARAAEETARELEAELGRVLTDCHDLPTADLRAELAGVRNAVRQLPQAIAVLSKLKELPEVIATSLRRIPATVPQIECAASRQTWEEYRQTHSAVERFDASVRDGAVRRLEETLGPWLTANATEIRHRVRTRVRENLKLIGVSAGVLTPTEKETKQSYTRGRRGLEHEFGKTMRFKAIRELIEGETGPLIRDLKPVWLMSPLSVSDTLPLDPGFVDVVIFDEASQIPLEEAIPTLFRGRQVIVVGDEKQLPPTDFFSSRSPDEADETFSETAPESDGSAEPEPATIDLADDSFLRFAARNLPSTMLEWHYRSRSESLIAFSNQAFYNGRLLTVPDPLPLSGGSTPADRLATGSQGVELLLSRPVSFHFLQQGVYEKRRNRQEAETIARLVAGLLERSPELTIGVIAFSEAQQSEIDSALERLAQADPEFRRRLEAEREREIDGQFVGLLVKNLENIQGDERDVVIVSICYGPNPLGKMYMNFGPINRDGGERRLNVAFSRAKQHMAVVSSIHADAVTNDYNPGALCLKNYLAYAEAVSRGDVAASNRVLTSLTRARHETADHAEDSPDNAVASDLCRELVTRGFIVDRGVGVSRFRVDMAIRRPEDRSYRLGILVDTVEQYATTDPLEREFIRPKLLQSFGWNVTSVLACDWFDRREVELQRILELLRQVPNAKVSAANSDAEVAKSADDATPESSLETADEEQEISLPPALEDSAD